MIVVRHIPDHGSTKLLVDVGAVTVGQLLHMVQERRNVRFDYAEIFFNLILFSDFLLVTLICCSKFSVAKTI